MNKTPLIGANRLTHVAGLTQWLILIMVCAVSGSLQAGIYKWTDEHGRVHYGDRPGDTPAQEIEINEHTIKQPDSKSIDRKIKQQRLLQLFADEREEKKKEQIDKANEKIMRRNTCNKARNYLQEILASGYLYEEDEDGNRHILSTEEFEAHLAETETMIEKYCS